MAKRIVKIFAIIFIVLIVLVLLTLLALFCLYYNEIRTLRSVREQDAHPLYTMTYYADYGFDAFLEQGAASDLEMEQYIKQHILKGLPVDFGTYDGAACTAFVAQNETGEWLYGRNMDFPYAAVMIVETRPANGYASVSTVNFSFTGLDKERMEKVSDRIPALAVPYLGFDGMNEKGVAISLLAVPEAHPGRDTAKITLNSTAMIRLVLDKAATLDEAISLMSQYNIYFSADVPCQYLVADASGKSAIVVYWGDRMQVQCKSEAYQIASNFIPLPDVMLGQGSDEFARFGTVEKTLIENGGRLSEAQVADLLMQVGIYAPDGADRLQWTVIYNLSAMQASHFVHRDLETKVVTLVEEKRKTK